MSENSFLTKIRRRRGTTSPPLVGVELNPGPKSKARRNHAKTPPKQGHLTAEEKDHIARRTDEGAEASVIAKEINRKEDTVRKWMTRYRETGEMKEESHAPKRFRGDVENAKDEEELQDAEKPEKSWRRLTQYEKGQLDLLLGLGYSERAVADWLDITHQAVHYWKVKNRDDKDFLPEAKNPLGRPRVTTPQQDRLIKLRALSRDTPSTRTIEAQMQADPNLVSISRNTINRRLHEGLLEARKKRSKPLLTKKHKQARLEWANAHEDWTVEQWRHVIWSDESLFHVFPPKGNTYAWVPKGETKKRKRKAIDPRQVVPKVKGGGTKVMVWGCFYAGGVGQFHKVDGIMTADSYKQILIHHLIPMIKAKTQGETEPIGWAFQQDNARVHTAERVECYLNTKQFEMKDSWKVLPWPAQSPDLNPIENLWAYLKCQQRLWYGKPRTEDELFDRLRNEWNRLEPDFLQKFVDTMPERIAAVIDSKGGSTGW